MKSLDQSKRKRIQSVLDSLNSGLFERKEAMNLAFLSSVAGESIFLLGPPGVAKSMIARRLKFAFRESQAFEYLMNRFSTPDEIFGPVSIKRLKDDDKYERITDRYLPGSNIVFLDEIWKAGPSIQNALLTILNEKVYRNGEQEVKVKLMGIISASNELPAEGQGLEALWDRFLVRVYVGSIKDVKNFTDMIQRTEDLFVDNIDVSQKIREEELAEWSKSISEIALPDEVVSLIVYIKMEIEEENKKNKESRIYVSDRRWKKIVRLLRASAFLNGREKVDLMDCFLIAHCIWEKPEQIDLVKEIITRTIRQHAYTINVGTEEIERQIEELRKEVDNETTVKTTVKVRRPVKKEGDYYEIKDLIDSSDTNWDYETTSRYRYYVKCSDYDNMQAGETKTIDIYPDIGSSKGINSIGKMQVKRTGSYKIEAHGKEHELIADEYEGEKIGFRKPHPAVQKEWDNRINNIKDLINERKSNIDKYIEEDLSSIRTNFFVDAGYAEVVETKLSDLRKKFESLELSADKLKYHYENISEREIVPQSETSNESSNGS